MLELTHHGFYVQSKIDGIESDIIVQNGVRYSHISQIGRKSINDMSKSFKIYQFFTTPV